MDTDRKEELLAKAQEAEAHAARTENLELRASWLAIAESYRQLAKYLGPITKP